MENKDASNQPENYKQIEQAQGNTGEADSRNSGKSVQEEYSKEIS